jgi:hypothetical protein
LRGRPNSGELREAAARGGCPSAEPARSAERPQMRLVSWKPVHRASLRGFATVELPIGLRFVHCPVFVGSNGPWVALPSKPVLDYEGKHAKPDDRPQFAPVLEWRNREFADRFYESVVDLIRSAHPGAPDGGAGP